jgi:hypothetical protein
MKALRLIAELLVVAYCLVAVALAGPTALSDLELEP